MIKKHFVYFYGSTKIVSGHNSLSEEGIRNRNQIVGFEGIDVNPELIEFGEKCYSKTNKDGSRGETGTMFPKNITIVPFRYLYQEDFIIKQLKDVINANELYIKADSIGFPLLMLKNATSEGYNRLGKDIGFYTKEREIHLKNNWCCYGHYYLNCLKTALNNMGYFSNEINVGEKVGNLKNTTFSKSDGTSIQIHADAGL